MGSNKCSVMRVSDLDLAVRPSKPRRGIVASQRSETGMQHLVETWDGLGLGAGLMDRGGDGRGLAVILEEGESTSLRQIMALRQIPIFYVLRSTED